MTSRIAVAGIELVTAVGIAVFWVMFFSAGGQDVDRPRCFLAFEYAFPVPDFILASALAGSAALVICKKAWGLVLSLVCAGALIFLGVIDLSFSLLNGTYRTLSADGVVDGAINLWCILASITIIALLRPAGSSATGFNPLGSPPPPGRNQRE